MKPVYIRFPNRYTASVLHDLIVRGIGVVCCFLVFMIIIPSVHAQSARETQSQKSLIAQRVETLNLQYLQLQNRISHENRQFTLVYNIMKNKHDAAKNAIDKLR